MVMMVVCRLLFSNDNEDLVQEVFTVASLSYRDGRNLIQVLNDHDRVGCALVLHPWRENG